ncbi:inorganic pyrophosphatase [bacterium]|nr:inorganic pyrophosphatase [bacterium]
MENPQFWQFLDRLLAENEIVIDRPKGSAHPRYPNLIYPLDYGYLNGTTAGDGAGIDVWVGTRNDKTITGCVCTIDLFKKDIELKILIGCSAEEVETIRNFHRDRNMQNLYIPRPVT